MVTRKAPPKRSNTWRNIGIGAGVIGVGVGVGVGGRKLYKLARGGRRVTKTVTKAVNTRVRKPWKKALGKSIKLGQSSREVPVRAASGYASIIKRRRGIKLGGKTAVKAGPAARSAFKNVVRKGVRKVAPKVRSTALAIRRR
jgi:hypothetical protein